MNSQTDGNLKIQEAMAARTTNHEYDDLPECIKAVCSRHGYDWSGEARYRLIEQETQPDWDVIE